MNASQQKRPLPVIVKIAVKKGAITKEQLKHALSIFDQETKEGKESSLPEILVKTGMISSETMVKLHSLASRYSENQPEKLELDIQAVPQPKPQSEPQTSQETRPDNEAADTEKPVTTDHRIDVSDDNMAAYVVFAKGAGDDISIPDLFEDARNMGIIHGLVREVSLQSSLSNGGKDTPVLIARGTPPDPGKAPLVEFHFDSQCYRKTRDGFKDFEALSKASPDEVNDGELLAEKTPLVPSDSGVDIFGRTIETPPIEDIVIRSGQGAEMFDDQLKVYSTVKGLPFLSVEGVIHVFPLVSLSKDYGITSGPVERDSCLKTSGTVTGEYPVKGGSIIAGEIRGANIDVVGSVVVRVGITGSVIKAQGDIRARSIRGCAIETYGSVYVENEIMDSTIYASGQCVSETSKIITSTIFAANGVRAVGIGTATSVPCEITVGDLTHIRRVLENLEKRIQVNSKEIATLRETYTTLSEEQKKLQGQLPPLVAFHKKAEQALKVAEARIDELKQKKLRKRLVSELATFNELKAKDQAALQVIRTTSDRLKEIKSDIGTIPEDIQHRESENERLGLDRSSIVSWAKTLSPTSIVEVTGELNAGTTISCPNASLIIESTVTGVMVREAPATSGDSERQLVVKAFTQK